MIKLCVGTVNEITPYNYSRDIFKQCGNGVSFIYSSEHL
jgi:hypothetical protein